MLKNQKLPLISVVMSVYNGEKYLRKAIESILSQSFRNFEVIVIDDGSTDKSVEIIKSFNDPKIITIQQKNKGLSKSLNVGINMAKGKYIARMDADDISDSNRLSKQLNYMSHYNLDIVGCHYFIINEDGKIRDVAFVMEEIELIDLQLMISVSFAHGSVLFKKSIIEKFKMKYEDVPAEDYLLWSNMHTRNIKFGNVPEFLYYFRSHNKSLNTIKKEAYTKGRYRVREKYLEHNEKKLSQIYTNYLSEDIKVDNFNIYEKEVILISALFYSLMTKRYSVFIRIVKKFKSTIGLKKSFHLFIEYLKYSRGICLN